MCQSQVLHAGIICVFDGLQIAHDAWSNCPLCCFEPLAVGQLLSLPTCLHQHVKDRLPGSSRC